MKIKKILGATALTALATIGLASCGETEDTSKVIDFYTTAGDDYMTPLNAAKETFEKEHEGWTVKITNGFSYDTLKTKVTQTLQANTQPSLAYCYPDHVANYLKTGKVVNMQPLMDDPTIGFTAEDKADFVSAYMKEGSSYELDGTYSIPMSRSTEVIYYNKTVFDEMKLEVPTTWDELWTVCEKLKAEYPQSTPLGYDSEGNWVISYLEQYGAEHGGKYYTDAKQAGAGKILFNSDVTKDFFKELKTNYNKKLFTTQQISGAYTSKLFKMYDDFAAGKYTKANYTGSFISIGSTGGAKNQSSDAFEVGLAGLPGITASKALSISQGPSMVMFDQGSEEKVKMTWEFVKLLTSTEVQASYCSGGYSPIRKSAFEDPAFKEVMEDGGLPGKTTMFTQTLAQKDAFYTSDAFNGSSTARTQIGTALVNIMKSTGSDIDAVIASQLQDAYDETVYYTKK